MTGLRLTPARGCAVQRVCAQRGSPDVMAGPLRRWRFRTGPAHGWILQRVSATG